jgi:aminoglycoside phosphotransferase (APT) family kinase protein
MGRRRKEQRPEAAWRQESEPSPDPDDVSTFGGEAMIVAGETSGGAPFGVRVEDFRRSNEDDAPEAGWVTAKSALAAVGREIGGPSARVDVGFVRHVGRGLSRDAYCAEVDITATHAQSNQVLVALVPGRGTDFDVDARIAHEARVLAAFARMADDERSALPFRVPRNPRVVRSVGRLVLVCDVAHGFPLDLRAGRQHAVRPWEVVGRIAAAVHAIDPALIEPPIVGFATRRGHALAALRAFDGLEGDVCGDARAWAIEHLPPNDPATLLHGDLLGQNILLVPGDVPSLIDWEYATTGDPAYDLAIVTRGVQRPFQVGSGLAQLLASYGDAGGAAIRAAHVRLHELCLAAKWYADAIERSDGSGEGPAEALARLTRVLGIATRNAL